MRITTWSLRGCLALMCCSCLIEAQNSTFAFDVAPGVGNDAWGCGHDTALGGTNRTMNATVPYLGIGQDCPSCTVTQETMVHMHGGLITFDAGYTPSAGNDVGEAVNLTAPIGCLAEISTVGVKTWTLTSECNTPANTIIMARVSFANGAGSIVLPASFGGAGGTNGWFVFGAGIQAGTTVSTNSGSTINLSATTNAPETNTWLWIDSTNTNTQVTGYMGGPCNTLPFAISKAAAGGLGVGQDQRIYIKNTGNVLTYSSTTPMFFVSTAALFGQTAIIGYNATWDDEPTGSSRPTINCNSGHDCFITKGLNQPTFRNIIFDGTANGGTQGLIGLDAVGLNDGGTSNQAAVINTEFKNFSSWGAVMGGHQGAYLALDSEFDHNCGSTIITCAGYGGYDWGGVTSRSSFHDQGGSWHGFFSNATADPAYNDHLLAYNNPGDGIISTSDFGTNMGTMFLSYSTLSNNTGNGLTLRGSNGGIFTALWNNLIIGNGVYGVGQAVNSWVTGETDVAHLYTLHQNGYQGNSTANAQYFTIGSPDVTSALTANPLSAPSATPPDFRSSNSNLMEVGWPFSPANLGLTGTAYNSMGAYEGTPGFAAVQ